MPFVEQLTCAIAAAVIVSDDEAESDDKLMCVLAAPPTIRIVDLALTAFIISCGIFLP